MGQVALHFEIILITYSKSFYEQFAFDDKKQEFPFREILTTVLYFIQN